MRLVYIAGPYAAPTAAEVALNIARAAALGPLALRRGLVPIVPHPAIAAGVYGDDDDPTARALGIVASEIVASWVARAGGELWVILDQGGAPSMGTRAEIEAWTGAVASTWGPSLPACRTWSEWVEEARTYGLVLEEDR